MPVAIKRNWINSSFFYINMVKSNRVEIIVNDRKLKINIDSDIIKQVSYLYEANKNCFK